MPKRLGVTNIKSVVCGSGILAIIDLRNDLYIVGKSRNNNKVMSGVKQVTVGPENEVLVLTM